MRLFKYVVTLLLMAALPLHGWASLGHAAPCRMQMQATAATLQSSSDACGQHNAMQDTEHDGMAKAESCQVGDACHGGGACALPATASSGFPQLGDSMSWAVPMLARGHARSAHWRPPRLR